MGKVSLPPKLQGPVKRGQVCDHEFPFGGGKPGAPDPSSRTQPPFHKVGASGERCLPAGLHRAEVGDSPGRLPDPAPPHLCRAAPCSALGRPQRSTGAPPGSGPGPRTATRSRPARPRLRGAPSPGQPPPSASGRRRAGEGPRGVSAPGRGHAQAPASRESAGAHVGAARRQSGALPPTPCDCVSGGSVRLDAAAAVVTLHPSRGPGTSGSWSLFQHKGPRRGGGRPSPSASPSEASLTRSQPQSPKRERSTTGRPPLSGAGAPRPSASRRPRLGPHLPHQRRVGGGNLGLAEAAPPGGSLGEHTQPPPTTRVLPHSPARCPFPREPRPASGAAPCSPASPRDRLLRQRSFLGEERPLAPQQSLGQTGPSLQPKPTRAAGQTTFHFLKVANILTFSHTIQSP